MFIMAANSWMQHPVGYVLNSHGQPELNNIGALFTNGTFLWGYVHVILAAFVTGSLIMLAVSAWQISKNRSVESFTHTAKLSVIVLLPSILLTLAVGSELGVVEAKYQPAKIAAAEAQWETCQPCSFSAFQVGGGKGDHTPDADHPDTASALAAGDQLLERQGHRPEPDPGGRRKEIRARATTCRTSSSSTGRCGSWPTSPRSCCC